MSRLRMVVGRLPPNLQELAVPLVTDLRRLAPADLAAVVAVAADDPLLRVPPGPGPLVVVAALGPDPPGPWARALLARADAIVLLDASEAAWIGARPGPVVVSGVPRPHPRGPEHGVDPREALPAVRAMWASRHGELPTDGPGVAWIRGSGAQAAAAAAAAWAGRRAVVALRPPGRGLLAEGPAWAAASAVQMVEATAVLRGAPALAHALGGAGADLVAELPGHHQIALAVLEAVLAA